MSLPITEGACSSALCPAAAEGPGSSPTLQLVHPGFSSSRAEQFVTPELVPGCCSLNNFSNTTGVAQDLATNPQPASASMDFKFFYLKSLPSSDSNLFLPFPSPSIPFLSPTSFLSSSHFLLSFPFFLLFCPLHMKPEATVSLSCLGLPPAGSISPS